MELLAFTAQQVRRLTGLSNDQLRYWDETEFFHPQYAEEYRRFGRIYSFRDVVGLRVIAILRKKYKVSLQELRLVGAALLEHSDTPWSSIKLWVANRRVFFADPQTGQPIAVRPKGQTVFEMALSEVASDMRVAADGLRDRHPDEIGKITKNRYVMHNAATVAGTRVPTAAVWDLHQAGYSDEQILREYPRLVQDDIPQALEYERAKKRKAG